MENWNMWLALSGSAVMVACSGNGSDSNGGGGGEADADTDADSDTDTDADSDADSDTDTDTDTDTDVQGWVADTIQVEASFGYDEATGEIRTMTFDGVTLDNYVTATVLNYEDFTTNPNGTQFCFVAWTLPDGPVATNAAFPSEYWFSFDLSEVELTYSGGSTTGQVGDCENMGTFMGNSRGSADLASFLETFDIGFGIQSLQDLDGTTLNDWRSNIWQSQGYEKFYGAWNQLSGGFAAASFTMLGSAPNEADLMLAYEVDPKTGAVSWDEKTSSSTLVSLTGLTDAPTAYYQSLVMYAFGD